MNFNRLFLLIAVFTFNQSPFFAQSIATARMQALGTQVTVRGIVTNGSELGKIRYLQDGTAGIAAYPGTGSVAGFDGAVDPGDSLEVSGILFSYHGLLEITPISSFNIISKGNPLPAPKPISISIMADDLQSQLVEFECLTFQNAGGTFNNIGAYALSDMEGSTAKIYLGIGNPVIGSSIPAGPVRLQAILSKYEDFQLLPRSTDAFEPFSCLFFPNNLRQFDISTTGFRIDWETSLPSDCILRVGTGPMPNIEVPVSGQSTHHCHLFTTLDPGSIYWIQIEAVQGGQTILSEPVPFATQSLSSGQIKTFFNKGIDTTFANGYVPDGENAADVLSETIARINAAQQTIDVAMYNNNRSDLTNALKAAHDRGVQVRYVAAMSASNSALDPAPPFPVLYGNSVALMHNKFLVIDADLTDRSWVMGGSLNWTGQNIFTDFNNTLFIQDQSLARTYEIEFEEMWGTEGLLPNPLESRFGFNKRDNTPHQFIIGGHLVESYFSPSDQTTSRIETALRSAESEALFAAFSFTKNELGDALVDIHNANISVRGIMENINDSGAEYAQLLANGVNVRHHNLTGEFHHKYGVVDAFDLSSDPTVITGSHNWSTAAETTNDENTLVLHDPALAALYKAEFEKRWAEFPSGTQNVHNQSFKVFPNPTSDWLELRGLPEAEGVFLLKNSLGQVVFSAVREPSTLSGLQVSDLLTGQYILTFVSAHGVFSVSFQKI
ncbi:MAG: phospholipase D-like domain-containing protein [Saprospiraceae bacterium]